jgi:hypothetical protein
VLASLFCGKNEILLVDYLLKNATITAKYKVLRENLLKGILFLQGIAAPHKMADTHQKLADIHFEILKNRAYTRDLAPSDCYFIPNPNNQLKGRKFLSVEEVTLTADVWFVALPKNISWMG